MAWGDYGIIFKWIDDFIKKGKIRRAKKLTALQKDLENVEEQINLFKSRKETNFGILERLVVKRDELRKKIQSLAR